MGHLWKLLGHKTNYFGNNNREESTIYPVPFCTNYTISYPNSLWEKIILHRQTPANKCRRNDRKIITIFSLLMKRRIINARTIRENVVKELSNGSNRLTTPEPSTSILTLKEKTRHIMCLLTWCSTAPPV